MLTTFLCPECAGEIEADATLCGGVAACPGCNGDVQIPGVQMGPGVTIGGFRLERQLGKGGMGEVYLATQLSMDREVAVKILPSTMTSNRESVERFLKEARMSAKLDHNNIVTVHDAGEDNGYYYYAMSCVRGESLEDILSREGPLGEKQALKIVRSVAEALGFAWERHQMLHRDIKPANVMIDEDGTPKVLDLGLAKTTLEDQSITMTGMIVGTPYYMSPEQARGERDLDFRSDLYSLGATLYHLLAGARPFESGSVMAVLAKLATEEPPPLRTLRPEVSRNCELLVQVTMAKAREDRYASYEGFIKDLRRVLAGKKPLGAHGNGTGLPKLRQPGAAAATMAPGGPVNVGAPPAKSRKGLWIFLGCGAAAVMLLIALAAGGKRRNTPPTTSTPATPQQVAAATPAVTPKTKPKPPPKATEDRPKPKPADGRKPPRTQGESQPAAGGSRAGTGVDLAELKARFEAAVASGDRKGAQALLREHGSSMTADQRRQAMQEIFKMGRGRPGGRLRDSQSGSDGGRDGDAWEDLAGAGTGGRATQPAVGGDDDNWDAPPATAPQGAVLEELRDAFLELDLEGAGKLLTQHKDQLTAKAETAKEFAVAEAVTNMEAAILKSFEKQRGQEISLGLRSGESLTFVPEMVRGGAVVGERIVRQGQTTGRIQMTIESEGLSIVERLKRMPPESDPAGAIMRGLEALAAGRADAAERFFGASNSQLGAAMLAGLRQRMTAAEAQAAANRARQAESRQRSSAKPSIKGTKPVSRATGAPVAKLAAGSTEARDQQLAYAREHGLALEIVDEVGIAYRLVPPGSFVREDGATVRISRPLYVGKYEVTQAQFEAVAGRVPASERGDRLPVDQLTWEQAERFAAEVCRKLDVPVGTVRLPTEAEWEHAARAGTRGATYFDPERGKLEDFANSLDSSAPDKYGKMPTGLFKDRQLDDGAATLEKVGEYKPNAYGLYDVYGNVFEWCSDWGGDYQGGGEVVDPEGPAFGILKIHRGGSFLYRGDFCNSSKRHQSPAKKYRGGQIVFGNALGVRLVREID